MENLKAAPASTTRATLEQHTTAIKVKIAIAFYQIFVFVDCLFWLALGLMVWGVL